MLHEPVHVLCIVSMIAGVLAPLMLMASIREGVMENVLGKLERDPNSLRIDIVGNHSFGMAELEAMRTRPEFSLVLPEERSIARQVEMLPANARRYADVSLVSTAAGDPLMPLDLTLDYGDIAISAGFAGRYGLVIGDKIEMRAVRGDPPDARVKLQVRVAHVLPRGWLQGLSALAPGDFVSDVEAFFDGYAVSRLGIPQGVDISRRIPRFESFRVYARDLQTVVSAEQIVEEELHVLVRSRASEIGALLALFDNVRLALSVLIGCATVGLAAAMTALFWANVERKRMTLAVISLLGASPRTLALFPVVQAVLFSLLGVLVSLSLFSAGAGILNTVFSDAFSTAASQAEAAPAIVPFNLTILGGASLLTLATALMASLAAAWRAATTEPAIAIRAGV